MILFAYYPGIFKYQLALTLKSERIGSGSIGMVDVGAHYRGDNSIGPATIAQLHSHRPALGIHLYVFTELGINCA